MWEATNSPSHDFFVPAGSTPRDIIIERYKNRHQNQLSINTYMSEMLDHALHGTWTAWKAANAHAWNEWRQHWRAIAAEARMAQPPAIDADEEAAADEVAADPATAASGRR